MTDGRLEVADLQKKNGRESQTSEMKTTEYQNSVR
jgi:hypothetical protein